MAEVKGVVAGTATRWATVPLTLAPGSIDLPCRPRPASRVRRRLTGAGGARSVGAGTGPQGVATEQWLRAALGRLVTAGGRRASHAPTPGGRRNPRERSGPQRYWLTGSGLASGARHSGGAG